MEGAGEDVTGGGEDSGVLVGVGGGGGGDSGEEDFGGVLLFSGVEAGAAEIGG